MNLRLPSDLKSIITHLCKRHRANSSNQEVQKDIELPKHSKQLSRVIETNNQEQETIIECFISILNIFFVYNQQQFQRYDKQHLMLGHFKASVKLSNLNKQNEIAEQSNNNQHNARSKENRLNAVGNEPTIPGQLIFQNFYQEMLEDYHLLHCGVKIRNINGISSVMISFFPSKNSIQHIHYDFNNSINQINFLMDTIQSLIAKIWAYNEATRPYYLCISINYIFTEMKKHLITLVSKLEVIDPQLKTAIILDKDVCFQVPQRREQRQFARESKNFDSRLLCSNFNPVSIDVVSVLDNFLKKNSEKIMQNDEFLHSKFFRLGQIQDLTEEDYTNQLEAEMMRQSQEFKRMPQESEQ